MKALIATTSLGILAFSSPAATQITPTEQDLSDVYPGKAYSPYAERAFPSRPLWGDSHLHTGLSMDAGLFGNRLGVPEAYQFARGDEIMASSGQPTKLSRPLDWLVVADHSDNMGFFPRLNAGEPSMLADPTGKRWYDLVQAGGPHAVFHAIHDMDRAVEGGRVEGPCPGTYVAQSCNGAGR